MRLTVAICTWNRAASLDRTLRSVAAAEPLRVLAREVLVVNNRCTDGTDAVLARHAGAVPDLRRIWQPERGLSHARNAAVDAATGDYVLWTDDDVVVERNWLRAYEESLLSHPEAAFFGGPIEPEFEGGRPEWITRGWARLADAYAERRFGDEPFAIDRYRLPFGANMLLRRDYQRGHRFSAHLGRRPTAAGEPLVGGDETSIFRELLAGGARGWWVPGAKVRHCIGRDRQTVAYVRAYFEGQGVSEALARPPVTGRRLFGRPAWLWRRSLLLDARYRWHRLTGPIEVWVPALMESARTAGILRASSHLESPR